MKKAYSLLISALVCVCACAEVQTRYVGGDISMLPKYEQYNSPYKDVYGNNISDLLLWFKQTCGWNTFRVRIFVNPQQVNPKGEADHAVCQDLAYVTALGQRIKAAGAYFMLDFHYSDTWVDALNIQAPAAWKNASNADKADSVAAYTRRVLTALNAANATPDLVQVGNEIMYGVCGIKVSPYDNASTNANWPAYIELLKAGCNAVRDVCPEAQIIIHTDRPGNKSYNQYYYQKLIDGNVDYDVIGLSYYPFWHGNMANLVSAINDLKVKFPNKRVQIVECAYYFQYWPSANNVTDTRSTWECSIAGQYKFVKNLVDTLKPLDNVDGISYWFPEDAGNGDYVNWTTKAGLVEENWSNRGFWNENQSTSGHAINKTGAVSGDKAADDVCAPYYMRHFYNGSEGIEDINAQQAPRCRKILRNYQLLIERPDGSLVSLHGNRL